MMDRGPLSPADDLVQLVWLMIYLRQGHLDCFTKLKAIEKELKKSLPPSRVCQEPESQVFLPLLEWVYGLSPNSDINYNELRFMLTKILLD